MNRLLLFLLISAPAALALAQVEPGSEIQRTFQESLAHYRAGDYLKAASGYEYLATLGPTDSVSIQNLALMYREMGEPEIAAAHWLKASLLSPSDPFIWNQRGWNYLALGRYREARDAFAKAVEVSSASLHSSESWFGLGLTESIDGNTKPAVEALNSAIRTGTSHLRPAAESELARLAVRSRRYPQSIPFFTESLAADDSQLELMRELGRAYEKTGQASAAWQAYKLALDLDPDDADTQSRKAKIEKVIPGKPADTMPLVRLARPLLRGRDADWEADEKGPRLRVALFSDHQGLPRHVTRFFVMGSTSTRLYDLKLSETIDTASVFSQWEVVYRADNRVIEVRDTTGRIVYVTKQPFRLEPTDKGYTLLLKNPEVTDIRGLDLSDRELRGELEIIPTPFGFHVVNELSLEQYLFSVIGRNLPNTQAVEAYKVLAAMLRTLTLEVLAAAKPNPERTATCDSAACIPYMGLATERAFATQAVRETRGITLKNLPGVKLEFHRSCGWANARGIQDRAIPKLPPRHPAEFERILRSPPDREEYAEQSAAVPPVWTRWARVLGADDLRKNLSKDIGPLKRIVVAERDETGRVGALRVEGARGETLVEGAAAIGKFLSPGSLRSTLFSLQPVYQGRKLDRLVVFGAGTGHGRGVCLAGVMGQAHLGRAFHAILRHYYPEITFVGWTAPAAGVGDDTGKPVKNAHKRVRAKPRLRRTTR